MLIVAVDRDAEAWQPRLTELQTELFGGTDPLRPVQLEVLDRATMKALERLEAAGLIHSRVRATRHLYPTSADAISPLSAEEKSRAADFRRQAAKKLKLAKILLAEDMADEATTALSDAARLAGSAFAVEERLAEIPPTLAAAIAPPLSYRWGETASQLQPLVAGAPVALTALIERVEKALAIARVD